MKTFATTVGCVLLALGVLNASGAGTPLPWPFPWARECPVEWSHLAGRYVLTESTDKQFVELTVTVLPHFDHKLVRVAQYDEAGELLADGFALVIGQQRSLRAELVPVSPDLPLVTATIKLHFLSKDHQCSADHLVPIMSMRSHTPGNGASQFRLVKVED